MSRGETPPVPSHVPSALVVDFDANDGGLLGEDPLESLAALHDKPNVFYTPRNGGHWVVIGEEEARAIVSRADVFSANLPRYDRTVSAGMPYVLPLHADPPDHMMFRRILAPRFTAAAILEHDSRVREVARRLIESIVPRCRCDFAQDIARPFQVSVFLKMLGVPEARASELLSWVGNITRPADATSFARANAALVDFLRETIASRRESPGDDIVSFLLAADYDGRAAKEETVLSVCGNLFVGGLDTVVATASFIMLFLGKRPSERAAIGREERPLRESLIDELIRRNGTVTNARAATRDFELDGVPFRAGDRVDLMYQVIGTDPQRHSDPLAISPARGSRANVAFGLGAHRCVGAHLARLELRILLEEWTLKIPEFQVRDGAGLSCRAGTVWSPTDVPLVWTHNGVIAHAARNE